MAHHPHTTGDPVAATATHPDHGNPSDVIKHKVPDDPEPCPEIPLPPAHPEPDPINDKAILRPDDPDPINDKAILRPDPEPEPCPLPISDKAVITQEDPPPNPATAASDDKRAPGPDPDAELPEDHEPGRPEPIPVPDEDPNPYGDMTLSDWGRDPWPPGWPPDDNETTAPPEDIPDPVVPSGSGDNKTPSPPLDPLYASDPAVELMGGSGGHGGDGGYFFF